MKGLRLFVLLLSATLAGCATEPLSLKDGNSFATQADRRLVISVVGKDGTTRVCAEPSPDAVAGLAAQLAAKVNVPSGPAVEGNVGFARTMASIGVRTAGLQILRDLAYRACEGVINGVITQRDYDNLIGGSGAVAVALVAVEGLTQMQPAPLVSVSPGSTGSTDKDGTKTDVKSATVTIGNISKDFKPEELRHVAEEVRRIVELIVKMGEEGAKVRSDRRASN